MAVLELNPIGKVHSCYKSKFGTPRQPGLVASAGAEIEIYAPYNQAEAFRGLEAFSHIWLIFHFDQSEQEQWKATVRPPRLGGNSRMGVFATRSNFRPNPIGLSLVRLEAIELEKGVRLHISGADLLDNTPILDIKPYIPYAESIADAEAGFAAEQPLPQLVVSFSEQAEHYFSLDETVNAEREKKLISEVLQLDPRPAYKGAVDDKQYGIRLKDMEIKWYVQGDSLLVTEIEKAAD